MANNQYVNKVDYGNQTIIDISDTTAEASDVLSGKKFYLKTGASATGSITSKASASYTPTTTNQTIAANQYLSGAQTILGDANLIAANIKKDVSIFGVTGNYAGSSVVIEDTLDSNGGTIRTITTTSDPIYAEVLNVTTNGTYTPSLSQHYYSTVIVNVSGTGGGSVSLQAKTNITPTESSQTIVADNGYNGLSSVQINGISSSYVGTGIARKTSSDLSASTLTVTAPAGYYENAATKTLTDANLVAENIKKDVVIFGVTGSHEGESSSPTLQAKTGIVPTTSSQTITADNGYDGLSSVQINAIPSLTLPTAATPSAISGYTLKATINSSSTDQYINIATGYNDTTAYYKISKTPNMTLPLTTESSVTSGYTLKATINSSSSDQYLHIPTGYNSGLYYYKIAASPTTTLGSITITPTSSTQTFTGGSELINVVYINDVSNNYQTNVDLSDFNIGDTCRVTGSVYKLVNGAARDDTDLAGTFTWNTTNTYTVGYWTLTITSSTVKITYTGSYSGEICSGANNPDGYRNIGFHKESEYDAWNEITVNAITAGTVTAPSTISGTSATVSTGSNTLTLTKTVSVTPSVTTAGYVSSGTAGNSSVSLTASVTTKAAATITPTTTNQTIASGTYLTGAQTISGDANLVGSNIISGKSIFGVAGTVAFSTIYTGSSAPSSSTGANGDIYLMLA